MGSCPKCREKTNDFTEVRIVGTVKVEVCNVCADELACLVGKWLGGDEFTTNVVRERVIRETEPPRNPWVLFLPAIACALGFAVVFAALWLSKNLRL